MKRSPSHVGNYTRGRMLLAVGILAAFSPMVWHLIWLVYGGAPSFTAGSLVKSAIWPVLLVIAFTSVWRGSHQNMRLLGWLFLLGAIAAVAAGVIPLKKPFPAPIWPSFFGWSIAAAVLLVSKDVADFVHQQRSKRNA